MAQRATAIVVNPKTASPTRSQKKSDSGWYASPDQDQVRSTPKPVVRHGVVKDQPKGPSNFIVVTPFPVSPTRSDN